MTPTIKYEKPPNYNEIVAAFPSARGDDVIFAYGDTIYMPSGGILPQALVAHETVHCKRQDDPAQWWRTYITDPLFRYHEELAAHIAEFKAQNYGGDRNSRARLLTYTARRLIAPLYEYPKDFTLMRALIDLDAATQ